MIVILFIIFFKPTAWGGRKAYSVLETAVSDNGDILKNHTAATAIAAHSWQVSPFWTKRV